VIAPDAAAPAAATGSPAARKLDVVDHLYGLDAPDPYRWMEGPKNDERDAWMTAQGERAAAALAKIPGRDRLLKRYSELGNGVNAVFNVQLAGGRVFYNQLPASEELARLVVRDSDGKDRVLVDPSENKTRAGTHWSLHAYSPSPDGKLVAYVTSSGGSELGALHVMDVASGVDLPDAIERVWGEGSASWLPDGKRFFYAQVPASGEDPLGEQIVLMHVLGKPVKDDVTILGRTEGTTMPLKRGEWPGLWVPPNSSWVLSFIGGARSEQRISIAKLSELDVTGQGKTPWRAITSYDDGVETAVVHGDRVYMLAFGGAPNRHVVSVPLSDPDLKKARVEIAEDPGVPLVGTWPARDAMYLLRRVNGRAEVLRWPWKGKPAPIALPYEGWAPDLATDLLRDGLVFQIESWLRPGTYFRYDDKTSKLAPIALASTSNADFSHVVAEEVEARSPDGTNVPLTIMHLENLALDGSHPTILGGYAAYGTSQSPGFSAPRLAWLERDGVIAIAHVRGGGERGRRWQDDGSREKKMNGIRDFIACGEYLVSHGYTSAKKLAVQGGSMGGILVGRTITERPDLFAAAHISVGFVNPLRLMFAENGPNQAPELGDPATEEGYRSLYAMDPYQHVTHAAYPAVIFTVGLHDHRVAPWMTAKMAARLLESTTSGKPVLVRTDPDAGHGMGSTRDQAFAERADVYSFFLESFGDPEFTPH
jgi:prolyl oligopeptidase